MSGPCLVCGEALVPSRLPGLLRCPGCGFVTADLELGDEELARLYGPDYFHGEEYADYVAEEASLKDNFRARLRTLLALVPDAAEKTLFEIGCAYGFFLDEARGTFKAVAGIDISEAAVGHARSALRLDARQGDYLAHALPGPRDVFCMWDTIEHLRRPDLVVAKIAREIAPGGVLALTTGDIGSLNARWRGSRWRLIHPPTHLHYFSRRTLERLLQRHGFEVVHVEWPGNVRTLRAILNGLLVVRGLAPELYRRLEGWRALDARISLNLFDIVYVVAWRRPVPSGPIERLPPLG